MLYPMMLSFGVSAVLALLVIGSASAHSHLSSDSDQSGPQKFHARPVPRIGGIGILFGVIAGCVWLYLRDARVGAAGFALIASGLPAFGAGFVEDLTKRVAPRYRLLATAVSAAIAVWLLDALITYTAIPGLDWVVTFPFGAVLLTMFVVAGVANSVNIIDGFNGLASMCVLMMLLGVTYVALQVGDLEIASLALIGGGAVLGFFIWNFPAGLIFLGDGGAYFLGFYLAELAILLIHRHSEVSPLFPLLICLYPVVETVFSIYRRKMLRNVSPGEPDGIHLHSLIYRRLVRWAEGQCNEKEQTRRNSMTSPYLWLLCMASVVPALLFWNSTRLTALAILLFSVLYVGFYRRIVRFKSPRWMVFRN